MTTKFIILSISYIFIQNHIVLTQETIREMEIEFISAARMGSRLELSELLDAGVDINCIDDE